MKRIIVFLTVSIVISISLLSDLKAQDPYTMLLDSTYIYKWDRNTQSWLSPQIERYEYFYGPDNKLVKINQYDNSGNLVRIETRNYTDSTMERIIINSNQGSWVNWRKYFSSYDNMHKEVYSETYVWENNEWIQKDKYFWEYDIDRLIKRIRQFNVNGLFRDAELYEYIYDQDFHFTEYLITNMLTQTPMIRILYTYNSLSQRADGLQQSWVNGSWIITGKILYSYNPCGNLNYIINQTYLNGVFINATKSEFFYSPHFFESSIRKVAICHNGHTIYVSKNAVKAHLAHGDCLGDCPGEKKQERRDFDEKEKHEKPPFTIYPNPAKEKITIKFDKDEDFKSKFESKRVELTDFHGKLIKSFNIKDNGELTIYRGNLLSGKYYIRLAGKEVYNAVVIFE